MSHDGVGALEKSKRPARANVIQFGISSTQLSSRARSSAGVAEVDPAPEVKSPPRSPREVGVDLEQGWYFGRAVPADQLADRYPIGQLTNSSTR